MAKKLLFNLIRIKTKEDIYYVPFLDPVHGDLDNICHSFVAKNKFYIAEELPPMSGEEFSALCPWGTAKFAQLPSQYGGYFMAYVMPLEKHDA